MCLTMVEIEINRFRSVQGGGRGQFFPGPRLKRAPESTIEVIRLRGATANFASGPQNRVGGPERSYAMI